MGDQHSLANKVTFACVAAAAGFQAIQQALKDAPDVVTQTPVPDLTVGAWNYLPIFLISVAVVFWVGQRLYNRRSAGADVHSPSPPSPKTLESRSDRSQTSRKLEQPSNSNRGFVPSSLGAEIQDALLGDLTSAELSALLKPHAGRWVRLSGYVGNVLPKDGFIHLVYRPSLNTNALHSVFFKSEQEPYLEPVYPLHAP